MNHPILPHVPITYFSFLNYWETHGLHGLYPTSPVLTDSLNTSDSQSLNQRNYFSQKWIITIIDSVILNSYRIKSWINSNYCSKHHRKKNKWIIIMFSFCVKCHETWLCVICGIFIKISNSHPFYVWNGWWFIKF